MEEALIAGLFLVWLFLTIIVHLSELWGERIRRYDYLGLIPVWSFFSPNPLTHDITLLYRVEASNQSVGQWQPVFPREVTGLKRIFANTYRRERKALIDLMNQHIADRHYNDSSEYIQITVPYIMLLRFIERKVQQQFSHLGCSGLRIQFALLRTTSAPERIEKSEHILLSNFHAID